MQGPLGWDLLRRVHENEDGTVSLETILVVGAVAVPILLFLLKWGWPRIQDSFKHGWLDVEAAADKGRTQ
jgi:hypothetical protein